MSEEQNNEQADSDTASVQSNCYPNCEIACEYRANLVLLDMAERNLRSTQQFQHRLARLMDRCRNTLRFVRLAMVEKYNEKECAAIDDQLAEIEEWLHGKEERPSRPFHKVG